MSITTLARGQEGPIVAPEVTAPHCQPRAAHLPSGYLTKTKALSLCDTTFRPERITSTLDRGAVFGRVASGPREAKEFI